jgi:hypothetical protein
MIFDDRDEYIKPEINKVIRKIGGAAWVGFLDSIKPYRGGNDILYALHLANNLDKHRAILELGTFPTGIAIRSPLGVPVSLDGFKRWPFEDEITIASFDGHIDSDTNVNTSFAVVLGEIEGLNNESVVDSLYKITDAVKAVIEDARTRFFP